MGKASTAESSVQRLIAEDYGGNVFELRILMGGRYQKAAGFSWQLLSTDFGPAVFRDERLSDGDDSTLERLEEVKKLFEKSAESEAFEMLNEMFMLYHI